MIGSDAVVKKMAQLMRQGATLTSYSCPVCGTPLLRLKTGELYCARCDKPVVVVKSDVEERDVMIRYGLIELQSTIYDKLMNLNKELKLTNEIDRISEIARSMLLLLEAYEKVSRIVRETGGQSQEATRKAGT